MYPWKYITDMFLIGYLIFDVYLFRKDFAFYDIKTIKYFFVFIVIFNIFVLWKKWDYIMFGIQIFETKKR